MTYHFVCDIYSIDIGEARTDVLTLGCVELRLIFNRVQRSIKTAVTGNHIYKIMKRVLLKKSYNRQYSKDIIIVHVSIGIFFKLLD